MNVFAFDIYERHLRRLIFIGLAAGFTWANWGSSFDAVKHIVFCVRTIKIVELSPDVESQIVSTLVPFGETVTKLIFCFVIWKFLDWVIVQFDPDWKEHDRRQAIMRNENEALRESLAQNNLLLTSLAGNLDAVLKNNIALEKHKDRIVELGFEIEKIELKTCKKREKAEPENPQLNGQDLFKKPKRNPPPRPQKPAHPEF